MNYISVSSGKYGRAKIPVVSTVRKVPVVRTVENRVFNLLVISWLSKQAGISKTLHWGSMLLNILNNYLIFYDVCCVWLVYIQHLRTMYVWVRMEQNSGERMEMNVVS